MVLSINSLRNNINLGRSESDILHGIHKAEEYRTKSTERLSSGKRINKGYEDIFSSLYTNKLKDTKSLHEKFTKNIFYARGTLDSMETSLSHLIDLTGEMNKIAVEAGSNFYDREDRYILNNSFQHYKEEFINQALASEFLGRKLLVGEYYTESNSLSGLGVDEGLQGISRVVFDEGRAKNTNISLKYDAETRVMTVTDLSDGKSESVKLSDNVIANGKIENIRFKQFDLNIFLDENFDKTLNIGPGYADKDDPLNTNNKFVNSSIERFTDTMVDDLDGDGVPDAYRKIFGLTNIKIDKMDGDFSDLEGVDIVLDQDVENDGKIFAAGGDEIKLRIKTKDGRDLVSNTALSLQDLRAGRHLEVEFERHSLMRQFGKKDTMKISFNVEANNLPVGEKFLAGAKIISLNELRLAKSIGMRRDSLVNFSFESGIKETDRINISFGSLDVDHVNIGAEIHLLDEESAEQAKDVIMGMFNRLNTIRSKVAAAQNEIEKSYNLSKELEDSIGQSISEIENTDVPIELALMMQFEMAESAGVEVLTKDFKIRDLLLKILQ